MKKLMEKFMEKRVERKELKKQEKQLKKDLKEVQKQRRSTFKKVVRRISLVTCLGLSIFGLKSFYEFKSYVEGPQYVSPYDNLVASANDNGDKLIVNNGLVADTYGATKEQKMVINVNGTEYPATRENLVRDNDMNFINIKLLDTTLVADGDRFSATIGNETISVPEHCVIEQNGRTYLKTSQLPYFRNIEEDGVYTLKVIY